MSKSQRINERQERMRNNGKFGKAKGFPFGLDMFTTKGEHINTSWGTKEEKILIEKTNKDVKALTALYDMIMSRKYSGEEIVAAYDSIIGEKYDKLPISVGAVVVDPKAKYVPPQKKINATIIVEPTHPQRSRTPNTIKIFDIPCDYTKEDIVYHLENAGSIKYVKLLLADERYLNNNTAIVEFRTLLGAKKAIEMFDRKAWDGSLISIKLLG